MTVNLFRVNVLVICGAVLQANVTPKSGDPAVLDATANPEAYEIYAVSIDRRWPLKDSLLLRQETSKGDSCSGLAQQTSEWAQVERDFQQQNTVERLLQHAVPTNVQYSFIRQSEIETEDTRARLQVGAWLGVHGPTQYLTVSSVGFNRDRTKAIVAVRLRESGATEKWELKDGKWQSAGAVCIWAT
jgi:hypothetical protein